MFDANTVELINGAPSLEGLDLGSLPQSITAAYASIVAARIRLRSNAQELPSISEEVQASVDQLRRLAFTQEALVAVAPDRRDREAACFVAGTAHHIVLQAERLTNPARRNTRLDIDSISPEVSATLLFLAADAVADAAEISKEIDPAEATHGIERILLRSIKHLATGRLKAILRMKEVVPRRSPGMTAAEFATAVLYLMLWRGIRILVQRLLDVTEDEDGWLIAQQDPVAEFRAVEQLCSYSAAQTEVNPNEAILSVYAGPSHLASLLIAVARHLPDAATAILPGPKNLDSDRWGKLMQEIATRRPYLWRNHLAAIKQGFLEIGTSAVLTFPTGAGKSTMSELKIATALLRDRKVVFLAPTLALVDQTARALEKMFPAAKVRRERAQESSVDFDEESLPEIAVMTPERCLALLSFNAEAFGEVGLLIFDECHLLHPRGGDRSRRAVDSMLCLLNFITNVPEADLLLISAMISNAEALAEWIQDLTARPCFSLNLTWKPTRQVRGCVVYESEEIRALSRVLKSGRALRKSANPSAELKRKMKAKPFGFFCLHQTWQLTQRGAYSLLALLEDPVNLAIGKAGNGWYLTPNANEVAASIALGAARGSDSNRPVKTLVFAQTIPHAHSIVQRVENVLTSSFCLLSEQERKLYSIAVDEVGGEDYLYVKVSAENTLKSACTSHHGLLLPAERQLHESLFRREDGINVLVATSTLAQGMNLPSQIVIIAGDSRFDSAANQMEKIEAHELLNAAGRAGRAGDNSYGFVLVIPSKVVDFDDASSQIHNHWLQLQSIFSQSDQCLPIEDPLAPILDRIHAAGEDCEEPELYFLRRLPFGTEDDVDEPARRLLQRSMAAFQRKKSGDQQWVEDRIASAMALRRLERGSSEPHHWTDEVASAAGIDVRIIRGLVARETAKPLPSNASVSDWISWLFEWLEEEPKLIVQLTRPGGLEGLLGAPYKKIEDENERGRYALPILLNLLKLWMDGRTLADLERAAFGSKNGLGKCEKAREFVLRMVPELAYVFSLPSQIDLARRSAMNDWAEPNASIVALASCVRNGLNSIDMLALYQIKEGKLSRRKLHEQAKLLLAQYPSIPAQDVPMARVLARVRRALNQME
ncbi:MAG: DEAD/DEAH box helicase [Variovorax sp.]|nr:DEAD/DEAH box helicase [Variovorax sp.]